VAGPLAQALRAARLSEQLQASRGRVVAALEEERRRMRRDLHDGLGPTLTGIAYSADAARNLLPAGSESAAAELRALRADAAEAIAEIRRIVYGLRPKALDELGLLGALRQRLERLRVADGRPLVVTFTGPTQLPELPAAVEVVAYRVVLEAVTNVARHAGVDRARVELTLDEPGRLGIAVSGQGDGPGEPAAVDPWTPGVGLTSMRERVEQIGGVLTVEAGPAGGLVRARVPTTLELPD
jgi:signal transduction histidine kinase